ncbi:MAG: DUF128 domain-containing protein [Candidatus Omnitrophota bacterium]|nr:MAG: DUF128 domain-containing protein [Candidatus Omnitrophota bacterium]
MKDINPKQKVAILRILRDAGEAIGSATIADELAAYGFELSGRTIRLYLQEMEQDGLVTPARRGREGGRTITPAGYEEIHDALVTNRVGFMASKVDELACRTTLNLRSRSGLVVLNVTTIDETQLNRAIREMVPVFKMGMGMGEFIVLARAGECLGSFRVPPGKVGIGTVCSVTINGVLLSARIPAVSRFGGVLEVHDGRPVRFTDVIYYNGTSLDPLEIFIKGGLTSVREAARTGHGRIGASLREIPTASLSETRTIRSRLEEIGLNGILMLGKPNQSLLEFPIDEGRTGMIVTGGLNPTAAIQEAGIPTSNIALCTMVEFDRLIHFKKEMANVMAREEFRTMEFE